MSNTSLTNTSADPIIVTLDLIQLNMGRYLYPIIFSLGNIGSILNIVILTQRVYLQNSCSCYILVSSVINLFIVNIIIFFHMLAFGFNIDPTTTSLFFCKFRQYISHVTTLLSRIYIVLACIDRWAMTSTNVKRRAFSRVKVAKIIIPSVGIGRCTVVLRVYSIYYNIYNTILSGFLTPIIMIVFGFLTIRNIQLSRQRVNAQVNVKQILANQRQSKTNTKSREYEILIMILIQLGVYLITCLPFPMHLVYSTVTMQWTKSNVQLALDRFYANIAFALTNINFSATFYIYVLTTRVFRKDLKRILVERRLFKICFDTQFVPPIMRTTNGTIRTVAIVMNQPKSRNIQSRKY
ncbi:unnamed protein product [Rotaria sp. Silwood2]|nr:unnamed protein product [Rotaria sp. Silwood2]CAF3894061.1 unnamed protein product [Rotaria sp. Silwood2]